MPRHTCVEAGGKDDPAANTGKGGGGGGGGGGAVGAAVGGSLAGILVLALVVFLVFRKRGQGQSNRGVGGAVQLGMNVRYDAFRKRDEEADGSSMYEDPSNYAAPSELCE